MEKYKNQKKLKNLAQRIVTKEKYKKVGMLQRHKHGTHAPQPDSSVAVHYSFNAETWREILEILEILQDYMQIAQILQLQCRRYKYHAVQQLFRSRYTLMFEECLDERAVIVVRLDQFSQIHSKYTGSTLMLLLQYRCSSNIYCN